MHEVRWMLAQCQACVTGADAAAWVLKPRVLCPMTTVTYRRDTGLIIPYVSTGDNFLRGMALYELRALSIDREVLERLD